MDQSTDPEPTSQDEKIMKPKRTRTITPEQKQILAERMRKVNEDRIAKAKVANETILQAKEEKVKARLETIQKKKDKIKELKAQVAPVAPVAPVAQEQPIKEKKPKKVKKVIVQESSDSEDYGDETEEEVIYVTKPKSSLTKAKKEVKKQPEVKPYSATNITSEAKMVFKFI